MEETPSCLKVKPGLINSTTRHRFDLDDNDIMLQMQNRLCKVTSYNLKNNSVRLRPPGSTDSYTFDLNDLEENDKEDSPQITNPVIFNPDKLDI